MLSHSLTSALLVLSVTLSASHAALASPSSTKTRAPQHRHGVNMKGTSNPQRFQSSGSSATSNSASKNNSAPTSVGDFQDLLYIVDVVIGGQTFPVQMDTGSSDLWVYPGDAKIKLNENPLNITATESYGAGVATGPVEFAELEFAGFTVPNQAFIPATSAVDFGFLEFNEGAVGILGLSFEESPINFAVQGALNDPDSTMGATPIFNVVLNNPNMPNSFDILLDRTGDLDNTALGTLVVGSHLEGFEDITEQQRLPRVFKSRWSVPTDAMHVNGKAFKFGPSGVSGLKEGQISTLLDTGFTLPPLPPAAADFIYSSIPGAVFAGRSFPQWYVPCLGTANLTFTLGGIEFPVHPLDLTIVQTNLVTVNGKSENVTVCHNAYQYFDLDPTAFDGFDAVLGDAFLRNVYASFDYGDTNSTGEQAFVQLISTTDFETAIPDFVASRSQALSTLPPEIDPSKYVQILNSTHSTTDSTDDVSGAVDNTSSSSPSPSSAASAGSDDQLYDLVKKYGPIVIGLLAGNVLIGTLLLFVGLFVCAKGVIRSGTTTRSIKSTYAPVRFKDAELASGYRD